MNKRKNMTPGLVMLIIAVTAMVSISADRLILRKQAGIGVASINRAMKLVEERFVGEYEDSEVTDAALSGLVQGLGDRWSYYLTEEELQQQQQRRTNNYVGIGITIDRSYEQGLLILDVIPDSPAERAGLKAGEVLVAVDGQNLRKKTNEERVALVSGEEGTTVELEVLDINGNRRTVKADRMKLENNPVTCELRQDGLGYIHLANFYDNSADHLLSAVEELQEQGARGLVFDMRYNGGGYVHELTAMLDALLPEGPVFIMKNRNGDEEVIQSDAECVDLPMAVLVNGDTYSAAEFFAAELQEKIGAFIVGEPTTGKGYSQQTFTLPNGGAVAISTGVYTTGSGVSLIGAGLTLDRQVSMTETGDRQLDAAVELLLDRLET